MVEVIVVSNVSYYLQFGGFLLFLRRTPERRFDNSFRAVTTCGSGSDELCSDGHNLLLDDAIIVIVLHTFWKVDYFDTTIETI